MAGKQTDRTAPAAGSDPAWPQILSESRSLADTLPNLLIEAHHVANAVTSGWHGRRRVGSGENFWQFRPFNMDEPIKRVDWRRSARDDQLYVREREWEAAHTIWLWADLSSSMTLRSSLAAHSKRERAVILLLAMGELLSSVGERVGLPGIIPPVAHRHGGERLANALTHLKAPTPLPASDEIRRHSEIIIFADFLDPAEKTINWMRKIAATGARGHLVMILDPIEESFPFSGRTEFQDPETGMKLTTGRAQDWREAYQKKLSAHREQLMSAARRAGWSFFLHHTDRPATQPLLRLHGLLSGSGFQNAMSDDGRFSS